MAVQVIPLHMFHHASMPIAMWLMFYGEQTVSLCGVAVSHKPFELHAIGLAAVTAAAAITTAITAAKAVAAAIPTTVVTPFSHLGRPPLKQLLLCCCCHCYCCKHC